MPALHAAGLLPVRFSRQTLLAYGRGGLRALPTACAESFDPRAAWRAFLDLFFFHAEDGIRALYVTGVQTCALPIYPVRHPAPGLRRLRGPSGRRIGRAAGG